MYYILYSMHWQFPRSSSVSRDVRLEEESQLIRVLAEQLFHLQLSNNSN